MIKMPKPTKRPKRTKVTYKETISYISEYRCPNCKITYVGGGPSKSVTRFICDCGQELIVESAK